MWGLWLCAVHCITRGWSHSVTEKKFTPLPMWHLFFRDWKFLSFILHAYLVFKYMPNYKVSFSYPDLWQSCAILSLITQRIFTFHNFCYLTIIKGLKHTNYWGITVSETAKQSKYFLKSSYLMFKMSTADRNTCIQTFAKVVNGFVDRCRWQVIPYLLQCTF